MGDGRASARDDELRLLAVRSEYGYTDRIDRALRDEPEAISHDEQARLTQLARRRERERRVAAFKEMATTVNRSLDAFAAVVGRDNRIDSRVRLIRHSLAAVGRDVRS